MWCHRRGTRSSPPPAAAWMLTPTSIARPALDEHVGAGGEAAQRRRARGRPPVERDAALAGAVEPEEEAPLRALDALPEGRDRAQRGAAWRLDEDDVGAEAGEELPRKRALLIGEIEDADAVQRARHRRRKSSRTASSVKVETAVQRSDSSRSASTELGPTSISTE